MPIGTSTSPTLLIAPVRAKTFVPELFSVPRLLYHSAPFIIIGAIWASVSTLFKTEGLSHRPDWGSWVGHQHVAQLAVIAAQHDKVPGGLAPDVVGLVGSELARNAVQVGGAEPRQNGDAALEVLANEVGGQVLEAHPPTQRHELQVRLARGAQPRVGRGVLQPCQPLQQRRRPVPEPGGVEHLQVVGVHGRAVATAQGVVGQQYRQRSAGGQLGVSAMTCSSEIDSPKY